MPNNSTDVFLTTEDTESDFPRILIGLIVTLVSTTVCITNVLNLIILQQTQQIPSVAKICLLNLSIADLISGIVCQVPCVFPAFDGEWPYGNIWCQIAGIAHGTCCAVSIWSLSVVSVDRYLAVKKPLRYHTLMTPRRCVLTLSALWCLAFGTFLMPILISDGWIYYQYNQATAMCGLYWAFSWLCFVTGVYIPVASGCVLTFTTVVIVRETTNISSRTTPVGSTGQKQRDYNLKAVKILGAAAIVYFLAWGPYVGSVFATSFASDITIPPVLEFSLIWLANSNSFMNVFIYSVIYKSFRVRAKQLILRLMCVNLLDRNEHQ